MGFARPRLPGDGLHPILHLELLLLEGGLLDLLLIAQDRLVRQGHEPALVLVVLLIQTAILLALREETVPERKRVLGHGTSVVEWMFGDGSMAALARVGRGGTPSDAN